jgi:hypothetical protein
MHPNRYQGLTYLDFRDDPIVCSEHNLYSYSGFVAAS